MKRYIQTEVIICIVLVSLILMTSIAFTADNNLKSIYNELINIDKSFQNAVDRHDLQLHAKAKKKSELLIARLDSIVDSPVSKHPAQACRKAAYSLNTGRVQQWMALNSSKIDARELRIAEDYLRDYHNLIKECAKVAGK